MKRFRAFILISLLTGMSAVAVLDAIQAEETNFPGGRSRPSRVPIAEMQRTLALKSETLDELGRQLEEQAAGKHGEMPHDPHVKETVQQIQRHL